MIFDITTFDVDKFDHILARGLSHGVGKQGQQVCIEAAICETLGLPHGDDPKCVAHAVRWYKIALNDSEWSTPQARAQGLHDLGLAQLGSKDMVSDNEFLSKLAEKTIRVLIPTLFRELFPNNEKLLALAKRCEDEGTASAASAASSATYATYFDAASAASSAASASAASFATSAASSASAATSAASFATYAASSAYAASFATSAAAASAASFATSAASSADKYLLLSAELALDVLRELKSPGISLLKG